MNPKLFSQHQSVRRKISQSLNSLAFKASGLGTFLMVQWLRPMPSNAGGVGSIPGQGTKIPHASGPKIQNIRQKQYCNKFDKDFKNGPHL